VSLDLRTLHQQQTALWLKDYKRHPNAAKTRHKSEKLFLIKVEEQHLQVCKN